MERRGPLGAVRRPRAARRARTSPPATTNYLLCRRPRLVPALRQRGAPQAPLRQAPRPEGAPRRGRRAPEIVDRLWRSSRTRPAARCRSSAVGRVGGDRRVSDGLTRRGAAAPAAAPRPRAGGLLASSAAPGRGSARDRFGGEPAPSALLVVLPLMRADYVKAFEGGRARTRRTSTTLDRRLAALRPRGARVHAGAARAPHARHRHALLSRSATGGATDGHAGDPRLEPGLGLAAGADRADEGSAASRPST